MTFRTRIGLVLVGVSLVVIGAWVGARAAQGDIQPRRVEPFPVTVLSGDDIGFRLERGQSYPPIGRLVVRIDGKWADAQFAGGVVKLGN